MLLKEEYLLRFIKDRSRKIKTILILTLLISPLAHGQKLNHFYKKLVQIKTKTNSFIKEQLTEDLTQILPEKGFSLSIKASFDEKKIRKAISSKVRIRPKKPYSFLPGLPISSKKKQTLTNLKKISTHDSLSYLSSLKVKVSIQERYSQETVGYLIKNFLNDNFSYPLFDKTQLSFISIKDLTKKEKAPVEKKEEIAPLSLKEKILTYFYQGLGLFLLLTLLISTYFICRSFRKGLKNLSADLEKIKQSASKSETPIQKRKEGPLKELPQSSMQIDKGQLDQFKKLHSQTFHDVLHFFLTHEDFSFACPLYKILSPEEMELTLDKIDDRRKNLFMKYLRQNAHILTSQEGLRNESQVMRVLEIVKLKSSSIAESYLREKLNQLTEQELFNFFSNLSQQHLFHLMNYVSPSLISYFSQREGIELDFNQVSKAKNLSEEDLGLLVKKLNKQFTDSIKSQSVSSEELASYLPQEEEDSFSESEINLIINRIKNEELETTKSFLKLLNNQTKEEVFNRLPEIYRKRLHYVSAELSLEGIELKAELDKEITLLRQSSLNKEGSEHVA